jgi:3'5'-cyclic nucleotide phosphodiesterase
MLFSTKRAILFQFSLEKEQGLPSVAMMDPANTTTESSQTGFIRFILVPLFESLRKVRKSHFVSLSVILSISLPVSSSACLSVC